MTISLITFLFYLIFFSLYKPTLDNHGIQNFSIFSSSGIFLIIKNIIPYILLSIFAFTSLMFFSDSIQVILLSLGFFMIFFIYLGLGKNIITGKVSNENIEEYKYIKTEHDEKKKNFLFLIGTYLLGIIFYIFLKNIGNLDKEILDIYLYLLPFIIIINFSDSKYQLILDIITIPFIFLLFYISFYINSNITLISFSYFFLGISLIFMSSIEGVLNKYKSISNEKDKIHLLGFADPYILYILLMILGFSFVPFIFLLLLLMKVKYFFDNNKNIDNNKKEYPLFGFLFMVFILYFISLVFGFKI